MLTPAQTAALNRRTVQAKALRDKTQILEFQQAAQPEQFNRTIEALTRPKPVQRTTAPYEVPSRMMTEAPIAHNELGKPTFYDGPPLQAVPPPPRDIQRHVSALQNVDIAAEMQAR